MRMNRPCQVWYQTAPGLPGVSIPGAVIPPPGPGIIGVVTPLPGHGAPPTAHTIEASRALAAAMSTAAA
ncbi:hypothetical protein C3Y87_17100 [Carbonactinospora thermoautotrophica]|nr:hypothetical protein [Carbonactinospora thermoautotrophica]